MVSATETVPVGDGVVVSVGDGEAVDDVTSVVRIFVVDDVCDVCDVVVGVDVVSIVELGSLLCVAGCD